MTLDLLVVATLTLAVCRSSDDQHSPVPHALGLHGDCVELPKDYWRPRPRTLRNRSKLHQVIGARFESYSNRHGIQTYDPTELRL